MLETQENKMRYVVGDSREFDFPIPFVSPDNLTCYVNDTPLVAGEDYRIREQASYRQGGRIELLKPFPPETNLVVIRDLPLTQLLKLPEFGQIPSRPLEWSFDKIIMICQQLKETLSRCVKMGVSGTETPEQWFKRVLSWINGKADDAAAAASSAKADAISAGKSAATAKADAAKAVESAAKAKVSETNAKNSEVSSDSSATEANAAVEEIRDFAQRAMINYVSMGYGAWSPEQTEDTTMVVYNDWTDLVGIVSVDGKIALHNADREAHPALARVQYYPIDGGEEVVYNGVSYTSNAKGYVVVVRTQENYSYLCLVSTDPRAELSSPIPGTRYHLTGGRYVYAVADGRGFDWDTTLPVAFADIDWSDGQAAANIAADFPIDAVAHALRADDALRATEATRAKYDSAGDPLTPAYRGRAIFEIFYSLCSTPPPGALPLNGAVLSNCDVKYPAFWQACVAAAAIGSIRTLSAAQYEQEVREQDNCGAFVVDMASRSVRLPRINCYLRAGNAATVGTYQGDAIRNITGQFGVDGARVEDAQGALEVASYYKSYGGHPKPGDLGLVSFDASRVVPTAGENRPKTITACLYIQVL